MAKIGNKLSTTVQAGLRAQALAAEMGLEARLPAQLLADLRSDIALVSGQIAGTSDAATQVRTLTGVQQEACAKGHRRIMAVRQMVGRQTDAADTRNAYGIGERTSPRSVKEVVHALRAIVARIAAQPAEAAGFGLVDADTADLQATLDMVLTADAAQEKARVERPNSTRDRNAAVRGIVRAVGVISALGSLEFADEEPKRVQFAALVARPGRPPKGADDEPAEPPIAPQGPQPQDGAQSDANH